MQSNPPIFTTLRSTAYRLLNGVKKNNRSVHSDGDHQSSVYVMQLRDRSGVAGTLRRVSPNGNYWQSMVNSEGSAVVFWGTGDTKPGHHVWFVHLDTGEQVCLTEGSRINGHPYWCPDNRLIVYFSTTDSAETLIWERKQQFDAGRPASNLWILDTENGDRTQLTEGPFVDERPAVSPDGTEIVFVSDRSGSLNLWYVNRDGSDLRQITENSNLDYRPVFSPDGSRLAYFTAAPDGSHNLALITWPEANSIELPAGRRFLWLHGPFWSADGKTLLAHGVAKPSILSRRNTSVLWKIDIVTGAIKGLSLPGVSTASHATWDHKEKIIAFDSKGITDSDS